MIIGDNGGIVLDKSRQICLIPSRRIEKRAEVFITMRRKEVEESSRNMRRKAAEQWSAQFEALYMVGVIDQGTVEELRAEALVFRRLDTAGGSTLAIMIEDSREQA